MFGGATTAVMTYLHARTIDEAQLAEARDSIARWAPPAKRTHRLGRLYEDAVAGMSRGLVATATTAGGVFGIWTVVILGAMSALRLFRLAI